MALRRAFSFAREATLRLRVPYWGPLGEVTQAELLGWGDDVIGYSEDQLGY